MDVGVFSDDWLQDILIYLPFPNQCLLRRCCRRLHRLLRSHFILRNVCLHLPPPRISALNGHENYGDFYYRFLASELRKRDTYIANIVLSDPYTHRPGHVRLDNDGQLQKMFTALSTLSGQHQRLLLHNLDMRLRADLVSLTNVFWGSMFNYLELRDIHWTGRAIQGVFDRTVHTDLGPLRYVQHTGQDGLSVHVVGPVVVDCQSGTNAKERIQSLSWEFCKIIVASMPGLTTSEMMEIRHRLASRDQTKLHLVTCELLRVFQSSVQLATEQASPSLDYSQYSPVVCRLLALWDGDFEDDYDNC